MAESYWNPLSSPGGRFCSAASCCNWLLVKALTNNNATQNSASEHISQYNAFQRQISSLIFCKKMFLSNTQKSQKNNILWVCFPCSPKHVQYMHQTQGYLTNSTGYSFRRLVAWVSTKEEISKLLPLSEMVR